MLGPFPGENRGETSRDLPDPVEPAVSPRRAEEGSRPSVPIVDERLVCALLQSIIEDSYRVDALTSPREAMTRLLSGERFDLILCDLMMPELTGMDLHEASSARCRSKRSAWFS